MAYKHRLKTIASDDGEVQTFLKIIIKILDSIWWRVQKYLLQSLQVASVLKAIKKWEQSFLNISTKQSEKFRKEENYYWRSGQGKHGLKEESSDLIKPRNT